MYFSVGAITIPRGPAPVAVLPAAVSAPVEELTEKITLAREPSEFMQGGNGIPGIVSHVQIASGALRIKTDAP